MNHKFLKPLCAALLCGGAALAPSALAQSSAFTYQGELKDGGRPATGLYEMTFALYDQANAVNPLPGAASTLVTPVTNGLFTALLDFGSTPFNGSARWMQVSVRTNGSLAAPVALLPRAPLGSAPHATYAQKAGSVADGAIASAQIATAAVGAGQIANYSINSQKLAPGAAVKSLNGLKDDVVLAAGSNVTLATNGNTLTVSSTGSGAFTKIGNDAYYTAGKVGIGTTTPLAPLDVVGNWDGEQGALNLRGAKPSLRFTGDALSGNQSWLMHLGNQGGGNLEFYRRTGAGAWAPTMYLQTNSDVTFSPTTKLNFGSQVRQMINLWGTDYGIGVQSATLYQRSWGSFAWHQGGVHSDAWADPGAGGSTLMTLDGYYLSVRSAGNERCYLGGDGNGDVQLGSHNPDVSLVALWNTGYGGLMNLAANDVSYYGQQNQLNVADNFAATVRAADFLLGHSSRRGTPGRALVDLGSELHVNFAGDWGKTVIGGCVTSVRALEITGGCDLAEPFPMSEQNIPEGSVVVIDDANPGSLKQATQAYDTRVAGIVSGANGINAGISLKQEGVLDQGQKVALTGRVYVKVDAGYGAIKPGDLLTTSDTTGHAMKAADSVKAHGAVIGKAMTSLNEGTGLVLVLVSLQ